MPFLSNSVRYNYCWVFGNLIIISLPAFSFPALWYFEIKCLLRVQFSYEKSKLSIGLMIDPPSLTCNSEIPSALNNLRLFLWLIWQQDLT